MLRAVFTKIAMWQCQVRLKGREHDYWMGTEIGMLGGYGFQGQVTAGDGADKQGKMGAGYNNLRRKTKKQQCKVCRHHCPLRTQCCTLPPSLPTTHSRRPTSQQESLECAGWRKKYTPVRVWVYTQTYARTYMNTDIYVRINPPAAW